MVVLACVSVVCRTVLVFVVLVSVVDGATVVIIAVLGNLSYISITKYFVRPCTC